MFEVAEYVLPKFEVTVTAPKDSTYSDKTLRINVKALYTYGKNVKGVVVVAISQPNYSWNPTPQPTIVQKQVAIDGSAYVEFDLASELQVNPQNWQDDFDVTASVTEELTGSVNFNLKWTLV